jgi:hypothetical protein
MGTSIAACRAMLESQVRRSSCWRRSTGRALLATGITSVGLYLLWLRPTPTIVQPPWVITLPTPAIPPAQVVVQAPAPPPAAPVPAPAPAADPAPEPPSVAPPVIGTRCVSDVTTIGVPVADPAPGSPQVAVTDPVLGATNDPDGCTIAAWTSDALFVSWDGGQTFARFPAHGHIDDAAATANRVVVLRDQQRLGAVHPGDKELAWRELGALAVTEDQAIFTVAAAGRWTAVLRSNQPLIGATDDEGATWRFLKAPTTESILPPAAHSLRVTVDGHLRLTQRIVEVTEMGPGADHTNHYTADVRSGRWLADGDAPRDPDASAWSYVLTGDKFWGCGGSDKLVALHHGKEVATLAGDLRPFEVPVEIASNRIAAYVTYDANLRRLHGARAIDLGGNHAERLIGVDQYGTLLGFAGSRVLRWSERGGWRVLWSVPAPPPDNE